MAQMWKKFSAYNELCFVNLAIYHRTYAQYMTVVDAVGPRGVLLSGDAGQIFSPPVGDALREFLSEFNKRAITTSRKMAVLNPNRLLWETMS
jgi:hypothetical protein